MLSVPNSKRNCGIFYFKLKNHRRSTYVFFFFTQLFWFFPACLIASRHVIMLQISHKMFKIWFLVMITLTALKRFFKLLFASGSNEINKWMSSISKCFCQSLYLFKCFLKLLSCFHNSVKTFSTLLLWSSKPYQGDERFLILICPHKKEVSKTVLTTHLRNKSSRAKISLLAGMFSKHFQMVL